MRAAVTTEPDPVVVHRDRPGSTWTRIRSSRGGQDVLSARRHVVGEYAVIRLLGAHRLRLHVNKEAPLPRATRVASSALPWRGEDLDQVASVADGAAA